MKANEITFLRRGLRLNDAASYVGLGITKFKEIVQARRAPQPKLLEGVKVWDRQRLDDWFEDLPEDQSHGRGH